MKELEKLIGTNLLQLLCFSQVQYLSFILLYQSKAIVFSLNTLIWSHCRRNNHQWRLLASVQDRCVFGRNSCSSCYFKISIRAFQCGMGYNLRGEYFYITKLSGFLRSFGLEVKSPFLVFFSRHATLSSFSVNS